MIIITYILRTYKGSLNILLDTSDLSYIYKDLGETEKSIRLAKMSISALESIHDHKSIFKAYILLSNSYDNIDSIQKYLELAESITESTDQLKYERVVILNNFAMLNKAIGNIDLSKSQYIEAIDICTQNGFYEHLSTIYNNYSYLCMEEMRYDSAKFFLDKALNICLKNNNTDMESSIYDSYSDYFKAIDDTPNALKYLELSIKKRKEYQSRQRVKESLFLSAVFESDQKEKELLKKENNINQLKTTMLIFLVLMFLFIGIGVFFRMKFRLGKIRLEALKKGQDLEVADALITGQDVERKRIAMDLHDGIGAQFGSLRLLMSEPTNSHERFAEINQAMDAIYQEIRNISHRMLPPHLEAEGLVSTIREMISPINKSGKFEISMQTNLERRLGKVLELNLFYIAYELVNNAIKHSKGNSIFIQLFDHEETINLSVEDNGNTLRDKDIRFGMGLNNIKTRVEYLNGTYFMEANEVSSQFFVEIPVKDTDNVIRKT